MTLPEPNIEQFSPHLFWDTDRNTLTMLKNQRYIIQQVLEYGLMNDLMIVKNFYGIKKIAVTAMDLPSLEPKTLSFISTISLIPKEKFKCYNLKRSKPPIGTFKTAHVTQRI